MSAVKIKPNIELHFFTLKLLNVPEETFANRWLNESGTVMARSLTDTFLCV